MGGVSPKATKKLISTVSEIELAVRLIEAQGDCRRPSGQSAEATFRALETEMPDVAHSSKLMARAALQYISECFANARPVQ